MLLSARRLTAVAILAVVPAVARGQATGTLVPKQTGAGAPPTEVWGVMRVRSAEEAEVASIYGRNLTLREQASFARIVADPALDSPLRASAWAANILASADGSEVKVQANLCDMLPDQCKDAKSGIYAAVVGPLDKTSKFSDVADLHGLGGKTRIELGGGWNLTDATWKPAVTLNGQFAYPKFNFLATATSPADSTRHATYSASAGLAFKGPTTAISFNWEYQDTYSDNDPTTLCTPVASGSDLLSCTERTIGAPQQALKSVWTGEIRRKLAMATAVAFNVAHDVRKSQTAINLPVWFVPDVSNGPGAGVRGGYRTDTRHWSLSVFVGMFKL